MHIQQLSAVVFLTGFLGTHAAPTQKHAPRDKAPSSMSASKAGAQRMDGMGSHMGGLFGGQAGAGVEFEAQAQAYAETEFGCSIKDGGLACGAGGDAGGGLAADGQAGAGGEAGGEAGASTGTGNDTAPKNIEPSQNIESDSVLPKLPSVDGIFR